MMETLAAGTEARGLPAAIGHTPLVSLDLGAPSGTRIYAKLESVNPGGSSKDRPVLRMLTEAVHAGRFSGGHRLLDSSSVAALRVCEKTCCARDLAFRRCSESSCISIYTPVPALRRNATSLRSRRFFTNS